MMLNTKISKLSVDNVNPSYRRQEFKLVGLIAVVTGFSRATRMFSIFEKLDDA